MNINYSQPVIPNGDALEKDSSLRDSDRAQPRSYPLASEVCALATAEKDLPTVVNRPVAA